MAWPTAAARTKNWGTEILTDGDLEGQFDLLCSYFNDSLNGSSGHGHTGGTSDGPKISLTAGVSGTLPVANGGTGLASYAVGDVLYASASTTIAKLSPSSAGQALTSAGATTAPTFSGMTTRGDVEYHNGTTRTALAAGTAGQVFKTLGAGADPAWGNALYSVSDYGTSTSSSTARQATAIKVCYGICTDPSTITNLPFTSSTSYVILCTRETALGPVSQDLSISSKSASSFTVTDTLANGYSISWLAIGT